MAGPPLIVEEGTGRADARSYVSVADARTVAAGNPSAFAAVAAATDEDLDAALRWAWDLLVRQCYHLTGARTVATQAGDFPRVRCRHMRAERWLAVDEIPPEVIAAQLHAAEAQLSGSVPAAGRATSGITRLRIQGPNDGGLEQEVDPRAGRSTGAQVPAMGAAIVPFLHWGGMI
jgi:hypothetical protein